MAVSVGKQRQATQALKMHSSVSVPDRRVGQVIGFYRSTPEMVLVLFAPGDTDVFPTTQVERILD
jgi:hypothetical protein